MATTDRMVPARHIDAMARLMQDDDLEGASVEYSRMLQDAPMLQDFAFAAGLTPEAWLSELGDRRLWAGPETLGDRIWLMSPETTLNGISITIPTPSECVTEDEAVRLGMDTLSRPLPRLLTEGSELAGSVGDLIHAYVATRGDPSSRSRQGFGPWFPGSDAPTESDDRLCPRMRDVCRMFNMAYRAHAGRGTFDDMTTAIAGTGGLASLVGRHLGSATLEGFEGVRSRDRYGNPVTRVSWRHDGGIVRDVCLARTTASTAVLASAWSMLDWLYAEGLDVDETESLAVGYIDGTNDWLSQVPPCQSRECPDDRDIVAFAHEHGDESCHKVFG